MLIQELQDPGVGTVVAELTSNIHGKQIYIVDIQNAVDDYKSLQKQYVEQRVILLGIRRGEETLILPEPDFPLIKGDRAILISSGHPV
jgi:K+/H+ antiporter YhaU regulatory subunit KhtT